MSDQSTLISQILKYINNKDLNIGDKLPSTLDLSKLFNVTPSKIRTALISLSSLGIIDIRPRAGSYLKALDSDVVSKMFSIFLTQGIDRNQSSVLNAYDFKTMIDTEIFQRACQYRSDDDLIKMKFILDKQKKEITSHENFILVDEEFHSFVATVSRNPLFSMMLELLQAMIRSDRMENDSLDLSTRNEIFKDHEKLFNAIKLQNKDSVIEVAKKHGDRRKLQLIKNL